MTFKSLRTGLAAAMGIAVLVGGVLLGAAIARADSTETQAVTDDPAEGAVESVDQGYCGDLEEIAAELGVDLDQLRQQLHDGATLEELADEAGVDLDVVLENVKERLRAEVDEMVAEGRLTQERADAIKQSIDSFGFGDLSAHGFMRRSGGLGMPLLGRHAWLDDLDPGVDLEELRTRLESGLSLEDTLAELGVDVDSLVESARQAAEDRIDQMLADGDLSAERAEQLRGMLDGFDLSRVLPYGRDSHLMPAPFDGPHRHGGAFDRPGDAS